VDRPPNIGVGVFGASGSIPNFIGLEFSGFGVSFTGLAGAADPKPKIDGGAVDLELSLSTGTVGADIPNLKVDAVVDVEAGAEFLRLSRGSGSKEGSGVVIPKRKPEKAGLAGSGFGASPAALARASYSAGLGVSQQMHFGSVTLLATQHS